MHIAQLRQTEVSMEFEFLFFIFVLSMFLGLELITKVPSQLHTPLMSGSNAISGISLIGALIIAGQEQDSTLTIVLGAVAVGLATINVIGGYLVTDRMLEMFKSRSPETKHKKAN